MSVIEATVETHELATESIFTMDGVRRGFIGTLPFGVGAVAFGAAFGVLAGSLPGIGAVGAILMSVLVYSGSAQMVGLDLWGSQAGIISIWATTLLISSRYVLLGLTTRSWFVGQPAWVAFSLPFTMSDEVWALTFREFERSRRDLGFFLGSGLLMIITWTIGTATGLVIGARLPNPVGWGIDFVATAAFTGLIAGMYKGKSQMLPWVAAGGVAIVTERLLPGQWYILIGAAVGMTVGVTNERKHHVD